MESFLCHNLCRLFQRAPPITLIIIQSVNVRLPSTAKRLLFIPPVLTWIILHFVRVFHMIFTVEMDDLPKVTQPTYLPSVLPSLNTEIAERCSCCSSAAPATYMAVFHQMCCCQRIHLLNSVVIIFLAGLSCETRQLFGYGFKSLSLGTNWG
jgi:hypothetical protein